MSEPAKNGAVPDSGDALPELVSRLGEDVVSLIDSKLALLKIEIQEDVWAYARHLVAISLGGTIGAVGLALVNVALAFALADLLRSSGLRAMQHAAGFGAVGFACCAVGIAIAIRSWHRLTRPALVPTHLRDTQAGQERTTANKSGGTDGQT